MRERDLHELTDVEQVCFLASLDGGRVDMYRDRPERHRRKIQAALDAGAITGEGWLTETGWRIAEAEDDDEAQVVRAEEREG
jgi:hypothetical protein